MEPRAHPGRAPAGCPVPDGGLASEETATSTAFGFLPSRTQSDGPRSASLRLSSRGAQTSGPFHESVDCWEPPLLVRNYGSGPQRLPLSSTKARLRGGSREGEVGEALRFTHREGAVRLLGPSPGLCRWSSPARWGASEADPARVIRTLPKTLGHGDSAACSLVLGNFHSIKEARLLVMCHPCVVTSTDTTGAVLCPKYSEKLVKKVKSGTWNRGENVKVNLRVTLHSPLEPLQSTHPDASWLVPVVLLSPSLGNCTPQSALAGNSLVWHITYYCNY